jgi:hypothetical protein
VHVAITNIEFIGRSIYFSAARVVGNFAIFNSGWRVKRTETSGMFQGEVSGTCRNHLVATFQQYINISTPRPLSIKVIIGILARSNHSGIIKIRCRKMRIQRMLLGQTNVQGRACFFCCRKPNLRPRRACNLVEAREDSVHLELSNPC